MQAVAGHDDQGFGDWRPRVLSCSQDGRDMARQWTVDGTLGTATCPRTCGTLFEAGRLLPACLPACPPVCLFACNATEGQWLEKQWCVRLR
jgi:hypothetical protein